MYLKSKVVYLYTQSPVHAGAGASLSAVDLPIQRERITGYPIIHAGGLKGALKDAARAKYSEDVLFAFFGPENPVYSSAVGVGDARILLFPVRSIKGVFAWATCPLALERWARAVEGIHALPVLPSGQLGVEADGTPHCWALSGLVDTSGYVVLEDVVFKNQPQPTDTNQGEIVSSLANWLGGKIFDAKPNWQTMLKNNLVILPDDEFAFFVQHATEVLTRVRLIPDTKTVKPGALWTEEHLPEDALLYAPVHARRMTSPSTDSEVLNYKDPQPETEAQKILDDVAQKLNGIIQLGGDETTGCGFVNLTWL